MLSFSNFFFIQPSLVVESLTNERGSLGQYFVFDPSVWVANFGSFVDSRSVANNVKVCRSGVEIWAGDVTAFEPSLTTFSGTVTTHIGRRGGSDHTASAAGDWEVNDIIVPSSTSCPVVSVHYMIVWVYVTSSSSSSSHCHYRCMYGTDYELGTYCLVHHLYL